jgi:hypothetical protein
MQPVEKPGEAMPPRYPARRLVESETEDVYMKREHLTRDDGRISSTFPPKCRQKNSMPRHCLLRSSPLRHKFEGARDTKIQTAVGSAESGNDPETFPPKRIESPDLHENIAGLTCVRCGRRNGNRATACLRTSRPRPSRLRHIPSDEP